jgi:succinyl-diaminopimelate desuccinylase
LGDFTYSINTLQAGTINNVVPDRCVAGLDLRTVPGQDREAILAQYAAIINTIAGRDPDFAARVSVAFDLPPVETPAGHPAVAQFERAVVAAIGRPAGRGVVRFATEAAVYVPALQVPAIIFGPGHPDLAHQPDEHAPLANMAEAARVYAAAALEMLA